ncbi:integral membrane protein 2A-like [Babylonia areolata]|uniref:integral membrane protein 2A-like n=1 Tax=Babylonia areolata TaxID=304850 RepID=UPI003FD149E2
MTIYKIQPGEKKGDKEPEVLTEPLTGVKDDPEEATSPKSVRVTYVPRRHRTWVNLCLILTALLVLGTGIIAAIFLYRHLSSKVVRGRCGVTYYDGFFHQQQSEPQIAPDTPPMDYANEPSGALTEMDFFEEDIEVSAEDLYEHLTVPKFDEVEETVVWHDFDRNLTAIVDPLHRTCYIMPLNRTRISPPRDLIDLIVKLKTRYYMPKASVVREQYRVVLPAMSDLTVLGSIIMRECYHHHTYRLERYVSGVFKRSVDELSHPVKQLHYGFFSWRNAEDGNIVYKIDVIQRKETSAGQDFASPL